MSDLGHVLGESLLGNLPRSKDVELNDSPVEYKEWAKYRRQNVKVGVAVVGAQESEY